MLALFRSFPIVCFFPPSSVCVCYVHAHSTLISHSHVVRGVLLRRGLITIGVHFTPFPLHCRSHHMKRKKTPSSVEAIRAAIVNFYISIDFSKHSWPPGIMALKNGPRNTQKSNCLPPPLCITLRTILRRFVLHSSFDFFNLPFDYQLLEYTPFSMLSDTVEKRTIKNGFPGLFDDLFIAHTHY